LTRAGFTGQNSEADLGLIDMRGRFYDPLAARFASVDPVMQAPFSTQGLNRYSYVFNNPINNTDPSGFEMTPGQWAGFGTFTGGVVGLLAWQAGLFSGVGAAAAAVASNPVTSTIGGPIANLATTVLSGVPLDGASPQGGVQTVAAPTAATRTVGAGAASPQAGGQNKRGLSTGTTNGGPSAPCGQPGNPRCGDPTLRAEHMAERAPVLAEIDQLAKRWGGQTSRTNPSLTIRQSTTSMSAKDRVEQTAGIVVDAGGVPRLTQTFTGDLDSSSVDWDRVKLRDGDLLVGTIHSHPGGPGAENFSAGDIRTGKELLLQLRPQGLVRGVGVQMYVLLPGVDGGTLNFNVMRNVVTVVP
jgi:RHS repeat-associated protein